MIDIEIEDEGTPTDVAQPVAVRSMLGRYRLLFELASGGMASVFLARQVGPDGLGKLVAIKRTHKHLSTDPAFAAMFLDEASITARIAHGNVCEVLDFGEVDGEHYLVMEYMLGETLLNVLRRAARLPADRVDRFPLLVARIIADACEGLHAAHEVRDETGALLEIVHRDVSPQNLFVTYDGTTKVVDFGIARARGRLSQTAKGMVKGKLAYVAPETLRQQGTDRRADVWSVGVCLWELVTNRRLFRRPVAASSISAVLFDPIPAPSSLCPALAPELEQIIMKALEREPDQRFATAREMGDALVAWLATQGGVTQADVAEWMTAAFAPELARRRELVALALKTEITGVHALPRVRDDRSALSVDVSVDEPSPQFRSPVGKRTVVGALAVLVGLAIVLAIAFAR